MKFIKKVCLFILPFALSIGAISCSGMQGITSEKDDVEYGSLTLVESDRAIESSSITSCKVSVYGYGMSPVSQEATVTNLKGSCSIDKIPVGTNRVVEVKSNLSGATLYALVDEIKAGSNTCSVTWDTTALGSVYYNLIKKGVDVSSFGSTEKSNIEASLPKVHATLIDVASIANDYPNLKSSSSYEAEYGSVVVKNTNANGATVQVTDLSTAIQTLSSSSNTLKANPGTWKVIVTKSGCDTVTKDIKVVSGKTSTVSVEYTEASASPDISDKLYIFTQKDSQKVWCWEDNGTAIATKAGYDWNNNHPSTTACTKEDMANPSGWYKADFSKAKSSLTGKKIKYILDEGETKDSGCTGTFWITSNGCVSEDPTSSGSSVPTLNVTVEEPVEPALPTISITPNSGSELSSSGTFTITVTSNCELTSTTCSINGKSATLKAGENKFTVSSYASEGETFTVTASVTNEKGTANLSSTKYTVSKYVAPAEEWQTASFNGLRIYQVMVSSFQDGDPSIGYGCAYGPSDALKGGDLQGIINSLDYIKTLGCNALWMTPIFESNGDGELDSTGYFAQDYFNIDHHFGTKELFAKLVEECHSRGMQVILDGVFGHHKSGGVKASPNGNYTSGGSNPVKYPDSLNFFNEVAEYWIKNYKIDGWRLDQCYQVAMGENATGSDNCNTGGHNYWYEIRKTVEGAAKGNGTPGKDWGSLGYMVGEHWRGSADTIQKGSIDPGTAAGYGLRSCFDFPAYYQLVQAFACEHNGKSGGTPASALNYLYKTPDAKGYTHPDGYIPNVMLTNHDLFRIGDLVKERYGCGYDSDDYAKRNMNLLAAQAAYTGPITVYYGDEIGDHSADKSGWYADNVARSTGKISGFNSREQKIHDYEAKLLNMRAAHPALWNGTNTEISANGDVYVAKKTSGNETIIFCINNGTSSTTFSASGEDLITGESVSGNVTCDGLSARFILCK